MADNVDITPGSGKTIATDEVTIDGATAHVQRVKPTHGVAGAAVDVSTTNPLPVMSNYGTATLANVSGSASSVTLQASNTARRALLVYNDSSAILYLKFGSTASSTSFTVLVSAGGYYELPQPIYTGIVTGIWTSATGSARVTEGT